jgi:RNA polymerase sigma-70 factor (ECF subfamily)
VIAVSLKKEGDYLLVEKELCSLLIQNPEKGLEKIMDQYMAFVYTIVYGKLSSICNKQDIEECVSDIFYEIYRARNIIDLEKGSLKSYLAVLSKRTAIDV